MPQANVIRWRDGGGWIVLTGGGDFRTTREDEGTNEIEAQALGLASAGKPMAYIFAASDIETADEHLALLEDLGAPSGYLVDALSEDDDTLRTQLEDAGLIILADGKQADQLRGGLLGAAIAGIEAAFQEGAVILAEGAGAQVLGGVYGAKPGLGWIEGAAVVPYFDTEAGKQRLRDLLIAHPESYALGIGTGSALALGPNGEVQAWGKRQITVTLGSKFTPGE
ncbi:MAG: hypothetical protein KF726_03170 [Anaerolineae bacterium]|nr:hypothetical protein [Anaerolineae bacterium]